jgi:hypothetical protein
MLCYEDIRDNFHNSISSYVVAIYICMCWLAWVLEYSSWRKCVSLVRFLKFVVGNGAIVCVDVSLYYVRDSVKTVYRIIKGPYTGIYLILHITVHLLLLIL